MRTIKIVTIIFLSCVTICLCAILGHALLGGSGEMGQARAFYSMVQEVELEAGQISSLKIDYGSTGNDVYFYEGTGDTILVREYMNYKPKENQLSTIRKDGETLLIRGTKRKVFSFFLFRSGDAYTEIYLPAGFEQQMEEMEIKTVSGGIQSELSFALEKEFNVSSTSGDISFPEIKADKIWVHSTSGNLLLESAAASRLSASTTSGDITMEEIRGDTSISSTSGRIRLTDLEGNLDASTTSGDLILGEIDGRMKLSSTSGDIRLEWGKGSLDIQTVSGDIRVEMLEGAFELNTTSGTIAVMAGSGHGTADTVSGDIRIFLENPSGDFKISTTSGSVDLKLPETEGYALNFDSTSGECNTFFDSVLTFNKKGTCADGTYGNGAKVVRVSSVSGDLRITKWEGKSEE